MDRGEDLRALASEVTDHPDIVDAWTAKSFTDRLLVLELEPDAALPAEVLETLHEHGLEGYNKVHDVPAEHPAFAGGLAEGDRHRFVDTQSRGELQSYVIE